MKKTNNTEPNVFRSLRQSRGLTIRAAAEGIGVSAMTVIQFERGAKPHLGNLKKAAAFYGVTLDCLMRSDLAAAAAQGGETEQKKGGRA